MPFSWAFGADRRNRISKTARTDATATRIGKRSSLLHPQILQYLVALFSELSGAFGRKRIGLIELDSRRTLIGRDENCAVTGGTRIDAEKTGRNRRIGDSDRCLGADDCLEDFRVCLKESTI
jgi:hypothetical protein